MKINKSLLAIIFCAAIPLSVGLDAVAAEAIASQSGWQQYMPHFMKTAHSYMSQKTADAYAWVSDWGMPKKLFVLGALLTVLVGAYYRDQIMQLIKDIRLQNVSLSPEVQENLTKALDDAKKRLLNRARGQ